MSNLRVKRGIIDVYQSPEEDITLQAINSLPLTESYRITLNGAYTAKGIGMRNIGSGIIDLTNEIPAGSTIEKAFLYWAVIPAVNTPINLNGKINNNPITSYQIIASPSNPWDSSLAQIDVYKTDVTQFVNPNTSIYNLTDFPSGITDGSNPVMEQVPPLIEGASLIVIYRNNSLSSKTIIINDGGVTVPTEANPSTTTFTNLPALSSPISAKTTYIVADGQASTPADSAIFNTFSVAGPGTTIRPADAFDGSDGKNLPNHELYGLWDTLTVDVSTLINLGDTEATAAILSGAGDALTYIAQVLSVEVPQQARGLSFQDVLFE